MRGAGARAAALLLVLVLGTAGCDLVDSLTPFGIGHRNYELDDQSVNGNWVGSTASGGNVTFQVGSDMVTDLIFEHAAADCTISFDSKTNQMLVVDGVFSLDRPLEVQGRLVITGRFTSATTCSGTYFFEALPAGPCPTSGSGTFAAGKTF